MGTLPLQSQSSQRQGYLVDLLNYIKVPLLQVYDCVALLVPLSARSFFLWHVKAINHACHIQN